MAPALKVRVASKKKDSSSDSISDVNCTVLSDDGDEVVRSGKKPLSIKNPKEGIKFIEMNLSQSTKSLFKNQASSFTSLHPTQGLTTCKQ